MKQKLTTEEKIALCKKIALSYFSSYDKKTVKDGATWDTWVFAKGATYWSPYFGGETIDLDTNPVSVPDGASFEALSYSIEFPDWKPLGFEYWAAEDGAAWKSHFGGHRKDTGELMDFFSYSYVKINDYGEITHWETHVNRQYDDFLDVAIETHGPFVGPQEYMDVVCRKLASAGIDIEKIKH